MVHFICPISVESLIHCLCWQVPFNNVVSTVDFPKINEWLSQVEKEMRMTLAQNLAAAVGEIKQFKHGPIDTASYLAWCDKYQAQLVVLAAQISWSEEVRDLLLVTTSGRAHLVTYFFLLDEANKRQQT